MHVSDHEMDDPGNDSEEEGDSLSVVPGRRFACDELYMRFVITPSIYVDLRKKFSASLELC